jgi:hypothetical protein
VGTPSPVVPSFTDGIVVHQADLNALASNLTNLYAYNQGGFRTQRPAVIAATTATQTISPSTGTLVSFGTASVNTDNMWTGSTATQITVNTAGIYWLFGQARWPAISGANLNNGLVCNLLVNGLATANVVATQTLPMLNLSPGATNQVGCIANLAAGAVVYLDVFQNAVGSITLQNDYGGSFLGAIFMTPST